MINLIIGTKPSTSKKNLPDESDFDEQSDIETEQTQKKKSTFSSFKLQIQYSIRKDHSRAWQSNPQMIV